MLEVLLKRRQQTLEADAARNKRGRENGAKH